MGSAAPATPMAQTVVLAAVLTLAVVVLVLLVRSRRRPVRTAEEALAAARADRPDEALPPPHVAVVVNPTKLASPAQAEAEVVRLERACAAAGLAPASWWRTTAEDPGCGQTREALAGDPVAVLAYGGDGTVRAVASELAGTGVPLGILPAGTGNLLARNLSLPLTDPDGALALALGTAPSSRVRAVDVGRAEIDVSGEHHDPRRETFFVMAGIGYDAEVMATVDHQLKRRVGWWAYILTGVAKLNGDRVRVTLTLDDQPPIHRWVRSVLVGNCGQLIGGVPLMPEAEPDDGWLDIAVVAPRGVVGWGALVATVLTRSRRGHPVVQHFRCRTAEIRAERVLHVQLDGDAAGVARVLRVAVDPNALLVRC